METENVKLENDPNEKPSVSTKTTIVKQTTSLEDSILQETSTNVESIHNDNDTENSKKMDDNVQCCENSVEMKKVPESNSEYIENVSGNVISPISEKEKESALTNPSEEFEVIVEGQMEGDNSDSAMDNEIVVTQEVINVDINDHYSDFVNYKNTINTNLTNELANGDGKDGDLYFIDNQTSLAAIALQYDSSDSENENSENKTHIVDDVNYRNDTSDSESDSSSSDSDSDSSSSSQESNKNINDHVEDDDEDEDENQASNKNIRTKKMFKPKGEFDDLPPIEDLKISVPEVLCDPLGEVAWTVEQMVVVRPKPGKPTLNLDTVLFIEKGQRALGHIFDVFGQVAEPHYCVRFNSSDHIKESDIKVGMTVYYCPNTQYTSLVFLSELTKMKATDEIGEDEQPEFSDDEEEQAYLANLRNKSNTNNKVKDTSNETPNKRRRGNNRSGWQSNHPWNSNRDNQQNTRPFYRTHHPWSRPRHHHHHQYPPNPWNQFNSFPQNQFSPVAPGPAYNYYNPGPPPPIEMPNIGLPPAQWNLQYQLPVQNFPQTIVPTFNLPPPPPPPPPSSNANT